MACIGRIYLILFIWFLYFLTISLNSKSLSLRDPKFWKNLASANCTTQRLCEQSALNNPPQLTFGLILFHSNASLTASKDSIYIKRYFDSASISENTPDGNIATVRKI
jgi:hypothetical protein